MKRVTVKKIILKNAMDICDIVKEFYDNKKVKNAFFEITGMNKTETIIDDLHPFCLDEFFHIIKYSHMNDDEPESRVEIYSNLDCRWEWCNCNNNRTLLCSESLLLAAFGTNAKKTDFSTFLLGFDFEENKTVFMRNFKNVKSYFSQGEEYLYNSVVFSRTALDSGFVAFVSADENLIDTEEYITLINKLGNESDSKVYYAVEDCNELQQWKNYYSEVNQKLDDVVRFVQVFKESVDSIESCDPFLLSKAKVSIKPLLKDVISESDWIINKEKSKGSSCCLTAKLKDGVLNCSIISKDYGHHLQALIEYENKVFSITKNMNYSFFLLDSMAVTKYLINIVSILNTVLKTF